MSLVAASLAASLASLPAPLAASAHSPASGTPSELITFGSPLTQPASLNTSTDLGYYGTYTPVPASPEAPNALFHTPHWAADTVLWNTGQVAPATGQALQISLEGCAQPAANGPAPLTQIHFQDITPLPNGGAKVNISSQPFDIPVCGQGGASGSTVTNYEPINLCVAQGDYVAFNDEGGYVPFIYRAGVPYQVIGPAAASTMDSFIRNNGTGNGAVLSASDVGPNDGFSANPHEEVMMRVTLGTGTHATHICAGGTAGLPPALPPARVSPQTDGVNAARIVAVAIYCRGPAPCRGVATMTLGGSRTSYGQASFSLPPNRTSHLPIRVSSRLLSLIRRHHGVSATLTAVIGTTTLTQTVGIRIF